MSGRLRLPLTIGLQMVADVASKLAPLVVLSVVVPRLGVVGFGTARFGFGLVDALIPLVTFGYWSAGAVIIGGTSNLDDQRRAFGEILFLRLIHAVVSTALLMIWVHSVPGYDQYVTVAYALTFLLFTTAIDAGFVNVATRRVLSLGGISLVIKLASMGLVLFFVQGPEDVTTFAVLYFGANGGVSIMTLLFNLKMIPRSLPSLKNLKRRFVVCAPYAINSILALVISRFDLFLVEHVTGSEGVGLYGAPLQIATAGMNLLHSLQLVFLAESISGKSPDDRSKTVRQGLLVLLAWTIPLAAGSWFVGGQLLTLVFSEEFSGQGPILSLLLVSLVGHVLVVVFSVHVLLVSQQIALMNKIYGIVAALALIGGLLAVYKWGLLGAAFAAAASKIILGVVMAMASRAHVTLPGWEFWAKLAVPAIAMIIALFLLSLENLWGNVGVGAAVYIGTSLYLNRELLGSMAQGLFRR